LKDRDISLLFRAASVQEKKQFKEILEELEKAFEDFKRESQELL
jgi:hypothetical protein